MSNFNIEITPLGGVFKIKRKAHSDTRGFLSRIYCAESLHAVGWHKPVMQINHTLTQEKGTVRGMHFQAHPDAEMKLITCIHGAVWDVAVDLRRESPTFLAWHAELLSPENQTALLIPEGVAHGFQVIEANSELLYCHSAAYAPESEGGVHPLDPRLAIKWPLNIYELSNRDCSHPFLGDDFVGVAIL